MTPPKISVVIPSFNKDQYIGETLTSIFDQNYSNLEVIIQDGGSNDGTIEIVKKFAKRYPNVINWESKKDNGQLEAINKGLKKASGDVVTFINPDDLYDKGCFKSVAESFNRHPDALWFAGYGKIIDKKGQEIAGFWSFLKNRLLDIDSYFTLLATSNYLVQPSVFIKNGAYKKYGPFTGVGRYVFEYEFWLKLGKVSMPVVIHKNLSKFRTGGANMTSLFKETVFKKDMEVAKKYSGNFIIVLLHWLNNTIRLLVNKFI